MKQGVKVAFASGSEELIPAFLDRIGNVHPELDLYVVSEFPPPHGHWIPYHLGRGFEENLALCRATLKNKTVRFAAVLLQPQMPFWRMRLIAVNLAPLRILFYNENLDHFMIRPRDIPTMAGHFLWRIKNYFRWQSTHGGRAYTLLWSMKHPSALKRPLAVRMARVSGFAMRWRKRLAPIQGFPVPGATPPDGISVVIPSRNGRELLARVLPGLMKELEGFASQVIVCDNGSDDGTAEFLAASYPDIEIEQSRQPLSFARAVNRGIQKARYSRTLLLNNDMVLHPGFFGPLTSAFSSVPGLFCATAQIFFPVGQRREETGKAVMPEYHQRSPDLSFPVRCDEPIEGEDGSYVLYGSGGCSLVDTAKARALGGFDEIYEPAYVEDLDFGVRAWERGWPTVFAAGAKVTHEHRATTSRYYTEQELERVLEINYLRFLVRCVQSPELFARLWERAIQRLNLHAGQGNAQAMAALLEARHAGEWWKSRTEPCVDEERMLALTSGAVAVFPGKRPRGREVILIAAPYMPFPLSHGGAVRMYNLMRRASVEYDQVLITFCDDLKPPPRQVLDLCTEIVQVRRVGSHALPSTPRPDVVDEFDSAAFREALRQSVRKWKPAVAQLEFTQMAQYSSECEPAKTLLVEHDITLDLYQQLLADTEDWELRRQWERWRTFEVAAWGDVDCVVTMSEKDRRIVTHARRCVDLPNGVDLERFQPSDSDPESARLLFIGSFGHLPNLLALKFFLTEVWPLIERIQPTLHIIAGARHGYFQNVHQSRVMVDLALPNVEVEDFVADVRPAYRRATVVIAPLLASAGTNIKIMEAMAMGKAIVSTPGGVNGLDVQPGCDLVVAGTAQEFAGAIFQLIENPVERKKMEVNARRSAERKYNWDVIAAKQSELYRSLRATTA